MFFSSPLPLQLYNLSLLTGITNRRIGTKDFSRRKKMKVLNHLLFQDLLTQNISSFFCIASVSRSCFVQGFASRPSKGQRGIKRWWCNHWSWTNISWRPAWANSSKKWTMTSQDSGVPKKVEVRNGRPKWIGSNTKPYFLNVLFLGYLILGGTNLSLRAYGFQMEQTWRWCGFRALNRDCVDIFVCAAGKLTLAQFEKHFQDEEVWRWLWGLRFMASMGLEHQRAPPPLFSSSWRPKSGLC